MASATITKAVVKLTESELREILRQVEMVKARADDQNDPFTFTDEPIPEGDMKLEHFLQWRTRKGHIRIESPFTNSLDIEVDLELEGHSESPGYRVVYLSQ